MMLKTKSGNQIRQDFIDFFIQKGHKFVPSSSLVPGGDQTLLFTNAGMVQFKDVFLGIDKRDYRRAVNSQKCMRVAGKHNDLDDVGRDNFHHTFFEMLGNWSFGDYYKNEAISWAWDLLTNVWGLDKDKIWASCFKDEKGEIETDQEAAEAWAELTGIHKNHILFFGREDNFWEMAEIGPCGPCSEIHYDLGEDACKKNGLDGHTCRVNGDCQRYLELWNLVFIQYNRTSPDKLDPLPAKHVDTGMGFERIVSVLQGVKSNYRTDLLEPLMDVVMEICGQNLKQRDENITPYRVIADHARAAVFLISDGVVPGNIGRNYICRMIIRRAARFGSKLGLHNPFLSKVAEKVIEIYGNAYPALVKNKIAALESLTQEELRFQTTVEAGLEFLEDEINNLDQDNFDKLSGKTAFDLYATHGLPLEITKDVLREKGMEVDEKGFHQAMEAHRISSGAGKEFGPLGGEDSEFFAHLTAELIKEKQLKKNGVENNPFEKTEVETVIAAIIKDSQQLERISENEEAMLVIAESGFYIESGGQVSDIGKIISQDGLNEFLVHDVRKTAPGMIVHIGHVSKGKFSSREKIIARVDLDRRRDIMRNHTATHLLHAQLRSALGEHVRQAGSLVAPDHLRFDFTHPKPLSEEQINQVEKSVNDQILNNLTLQTKHKKMQDAINEGAIALFGEKYGEEVRTIGIGEKEFVSLELCGGTHVHETAEIGIFIIINEGSVSAGIRRIEAVTGKAALQLMIERNQKIKKIAQLLECSPMEIDLAVEKTLKKNDGLVSQIEELLISQARDKYTQANKSASSIDQHPVVTVEMENIPAWIFRDLADRFRKEHKTGFAFFINNKNNDDFEIFMTITDDLVAEGYHAGEIIQSITNITGGKGGGRAQLAQGGGTDKKKLGELFNQLEKILRKTK